MCVNLMNMFGSGQQLGANLQATATILGGVTDVMSGVSRSRTQQTLAESDALAEEALGRIKARKIRRAAERDIGGSRADAAAAGVSLDSSSVLAAEGQIVRGSEEDALSAILTGNNRGAAARTTASLYGAQELGILSAGLDRVAMGVGGWRRRAQPDPLDGFFRTGRSGD